MIQDKDVALVGKVNKTHGINGEMSATFYRESVYDAIEEDTCLIFNIDGIYVPFFVDSVRPRGGESLLISLDGEDSQEKAAAFVGRDIYMPTASMPADDDDGDPQIVAGELIGFKALTEDGQSIGVIVDIDDNVDNPLFAIERPDGKTSYIPIVDDFIADMSLQDKTITFDLPEGLLEL